MCASQLFSNPVAYTALTLRVPLYCGYILHGIVMVQLTYTDISAYNVICSTCECYSSYVSSIDIVIQMYPHFVYLKGELCLNKNAPKILETL